MIFVSLKSKNTINGIETIRNIQINKIISFHLTGDYGTIEVDGLKEPLHMDKEDYIKFYETIEPHILKTTM